MSVSCPFELTSGVVWKVLPNMLEDCTPPEDATRPVCGVVYAKELGYAYDQDITGMINWYGVVAYIAVKSIPQLPPKSIPQLPPKPKPTLRQRILDALFWETKWLP